MKLFAFFTSAIVATVIAGCSGTTSPNADADETLIVSLYKSSFEAIRTGRPEPVDPYKVFTRELIDSSEVPVILAGLESRESYGTLFKGLQNRGIVTWRTEDNITLSFDRGVVVSSRGLGDDLMVADVRNAVSGIARASGTGVRIHDYLDGEDQIVRHSLNCSYRSTGYEKISIFSIVYNLKHVVEDCETPGYSIQNDYWVEPASGKFRQSRQWLGPDVDYVFLQHLTR